jgi:hypothetical protein
MAKKEIIAFDPPTEEEIMLIQPNNVTFGQYNVSEWQENLLTLIGDKIQKHMTREEELPRDLFNQPYVVIMCDEAGGKNNKNKVLKEAIDMLNKRFSFRWLHPKMKKEIETTGGSVITNIHNIKGTNQIMVNLNPWAIPFLIYYGVGVGGTRYSKGLALGLRGNYTKRIYKIICSQRDRREYYYAISQFRKDLEIPEKHSNNDIDRKILRPAQERIKESGSDVWFDYELICKYPIKGRKPKADTIIFTINTLHPREAGGEQFEQYSFVYRWVSNAMNNPTDDKAQKANKHKKSGRAFAYPQNRESKPYTHKQETPLPHMRKGIYTVFVVRVKFSTFVLH